MTRSSENIAWTDASKKVCDLLKVFHFQMLVYICLRLANHLTCTSDKGDFSVTEVLTQIDWE